MAIRVGDRATSKFVVDDATMRWFREVSGDASRIHCDAAYAKSLGYDDVIVYGGIVLMHLSNLLGTRIPGMNGTSIAWSINYHRPLYVGEASEILLEVVYVSPATRIVEGRFRIMAGEKSVATGTTQSIVPAGEIEV